MDIGLFIQFLLPGVTTGCIYALVALGFVLCANVAGVVNFAQGEYVMLGGLMAAWMASLHMPFFLVLIVPIITGGAVAMFQEAVTLRPVRNAKPFIQITTTVGFAIVVRGICLIAFGRDPLALPGFTGDDVFDLFGATLPIQTLWVWGTMAVMLAALYWFLKYTDVGRAVRACSINLQAARLMGVNAERMRLVVFAVSGAGGALAGIVVTPIVLASWDAGITYSLKGFVGAIVGGFRSPTQAVLAGLGIGLLEAFSAGYVSSGWQDLIVYGVLLTYLLIKGGVFLAGRATLAAGQLER